MITKKRIMVIFLFTVILIAIFILIKYKYSKSTIEIIKNSKPTIDDIIRIKNLNVSEKEAKEIKKYLNKDIKDYKYIQGRCLLLQNGYSIDKQIKKINARLFDESTSISAKNSAIVCYIANQGKHKDAIKKSIKPYINSKNKDDRFAVANILFKIVNKKDKHYIEKAIKKEKDEKVKNLLEKILVKLNN